ncbi:L-lactate permease [Brevibacterium sanguinis]|uniref:L-lactate permease n=1 Tax=Brevibacterium sanguinis TaxID=232444 RepID=UPI0031DD4339
MTGLLAFVPILLAVALLAFRAPTWVSAVAGLAGAVLCAVLAFPTPLPVISQAAGDYFPLIAEVVLILLFGMMLAGILEATGAMRTISASVESMVPSRSLGVALVVFGLVPFAESVTGFGIGVTIGVPILRHLGCSLRHSALLGLLGLVAVPWGALGPGTTVAAALAGFDVDALGLSTAWVNAISVAVVLCSVLVLMRPRLGSALGMIGAAGLLWGGILLANRLLGMAPAGIIGSLVVIVGLGVPLAIRARFAGVTAALGRAVLPYGVLTLGILVARELLAVFPSPLMESLASPPFWLAVACLVAALSRTRGEKDVQKDDGSTGVPSDDESTSVGSGDGLSDEHRGDGASSPPPLRPVILRAVRAWVPIGAATAAFMLMGWVMTTSGMSTAFGDLLPTGLLVLAPWLSTIGAVLTGSNTGSNAMFASTLAVAGEGTAAGPLTAVAAGNAAGSLAALAAPPRVAMAVQLSGAGAADARDGSWVLSRAFLIVGLNTLAIGLWLQFLA